MLRAKYTFDYRNVELITQFDNHIFSLCIFI